jgi:hypothetical protein
VTIYTILGVKSPLYHEYKQVRNNVMRIVLKTIEGHIQLYWIKKTENSITGWVAGDLIKKDFNVSDETTVDLLFTYPKDGNFHHSYKIINKEEEVYVSVYSNIIKTKIIQPDSGNKTITEEERIKLNTMPLSVFVPTEKQLPLDEVKYRQFQTISFTIVDGKFGLSDKINYILPSNIEKEDLVVDVTEFKSTSINLTAFLREKSKEIGNFGDSRFESSEIEFDGNRLLEVRCIIYEKRIEK